MTMIFDTKIKILFFSALLMAPFSAAHAQDIEGLEEMARPAIGLKHLKVAPQTAPATPEPAVETPVAPEPAPLPQKRQYAPLKTTDALVPEKELKDWPYLAQAATAYTATDTKKLVDLVEADRGAVPPQGLFFVAKALADHDRMDAAALFYFAGKLRLEFDKARWPEYVSPEITKRIKLDEKKTDDQSAPKPNITLQNPHAFVEQIGASFSQPILSWAIRNPDRFRNVLAAVQEWDMSAPYAYTTGYQVGESIPFDNWARTLDQTRSVYFIQMQSLARRPSKN